LTTEDSVSWKTEWLPQPPKNWKDLKPHPLSALVEFGAGIDCQALSAHMRKNGYDPDEPIILKDGQILDGRHKHIGAQDAEVIPTFRKFIGTDDDAVEFVTKKILRQHLNTSQRSMLAAALSKVQICTSKDNGSGKLTLEQAAETLNVSARSTKDAAKVQEHGTEKLNEAVRNGTLAVSDAAKVAEEPAKVQNKAVKEVESGKAKTASAAVGKSDADETPDEITDNEKHKVPEVAQEAFRNLAKFEECDKLCRALQKLMDEISGLPGGEQLGKFLQPTGSEGKTVNKSEHLNALKRDLKGTRPHSVCPYCSGKAKKDCKGCAGRGWVTATTWKDAEDSVKARLACTS
jgi:hypothetical protein